MHCCILSHCVTSNQIVSVNFHFVHGLLRLHYQFHHITPLYPASSALWLRDMDVDQRFQQEDWFIQLVVSASHSIRVHYSHHVSNCEIRNRTGCTPATEIIRRRRLQLFGCIVRSEPEMDLCHALRAAIQGPSNTWLKKTLRVTKTDRETVDNNLKPANIGLHTMWQRAQDSADWRNYDDSNTSLGACNWWWWWWYYYADVQCTSYGAWTLQKTINMHNQSMWSDAVLINKFQSHHQVATKNNIKRTFSNGSSCRRICSCRANSNRCFVL